MREHGRGSIVNIASVSGIRGNTGRVAYGSSKGGMIMMTKVMASELGPLGVPGNAVAPGPVEKPLGEGVDTQHGPPALVGTGRVRVHLPHHRPFQSGPRQC